MAEYPVNSLRLSHDIVELLVDRGGLGVTAVATALELPKSTAHDHLRTLEKLDYVVNDGREYRPSMKFLQLGMRARDDHPLFAHGRVEALTLAEAVGGHEHVQLATEENGACSVLLSTGWGHSSQPSRRAHTHPLRAPLHTNALGKAMLAWMDDPEVERFLETHGLVKRTPNTITDEEELFDALEAVRADGYARDDGELISGMSGIAAPVVTDDVTGAVAVYGATEAFDAPSAAETVDAVRNAAAEIRANLLFASE